MQKLIKKYYNNLTALLHQITVTDRKTNSIGFYEGIEKACGIIMEQEGKGNKLMFIGNGGSAAISSHMATDFIKNGGMKAVAFNDCSLLTCMGNDYGYEHVYEKPIEMFAAAGDVLVAISSSGKSANILKGTDAALKRGCRAVTLSGFDSNNPLSEKGELNFHVPSNAYGPVEVIHHFICHSILDVIIEKKSMHNY